MTDFKVTDGISFAAIDRWNQSTSELSDERMVACVAAALSHPEFRAQVAALMRELVPGVSDGTYWPTEPGWDKAEGRDEFREETLARIQHWEERK